MINRGAIILKYKLPAVNWINEADPVNDNPGITLEDVNRDNTVYLVSNDDCDGDEAVNFWIRNNYKLLFDSILEEWYTDPELWPKDRSFKKFKEWFDVEYHSMLIDTVGGDIFDDGI